MLNPSDQFLVRDYLRRRHPRSQTDDEVRSSAFGHRVALADVAEFLGRLLADGLVESWVEPVEEHRSLKEIRLYRATPRLLTLAGRGADPAPRERVRVEMLDIRSGKELRR